MILKNNVKREHKSDKNRWMMYVERMLFVILSKWIFVARQIDVPFCSFVYIVFDLLFTDYSHTPHESEEHSCKKCANNQMTTAVLFCENKSCTNDKNHCTNPCFSIFRIHFTKHSLYSKKRASRNKHMSLQFGEC